jgi:two-component system sensor histidine kinase YesM
MQAEMKSYTDIINKAQLTALQAQISPHFLYNTLENIRWRAMEICKGDNEVSKIILNLSEMLRISLESDQQLVSIEEEIKNTKLYINILQLRYEDKLQVLWEVNEIAVSYPIVKVSLQPIIENAVYHGIKPLRKLGIITIVVDKQEDKIVIRIKDNGVGMSNEMVKRLNKDMKEKYILQEDHIGIRNVNQRIKLLMGDDAGLEIQSEENAGTTVTVILPIPKLTEGLKGVKEYEI